MAYVIYLFMISSVALVIYYFYNTAAHLDAMRHRLPMVEESPKKKMAIAKVYFNYFLSPLVAFSNFMLERFKLKEKMLVQQGMLYIIGIRLTPGELLSVKLLSMLLLLIATAMIFGFQTPFLLVALAIGYMVPDLWLKGRVKKHKQIVARLLPETVDLMCLCMEAGLDFVTALDWIVRKTKHTPIIEELSFVLEEIRWGKPRMQALKDMSKRLDIQEVSSFVRTLLQAERMGTPVLDAFTIISEDTRFQRFQKGERFALQAPIKMLIPLIFCQLPVIAIIIGGPLIIRFTQGDLFRTF